MLLRSISGIFLIANVCLANPTDDLWKAIDNMDPDAVLAALSSGAAVNAKNKDECSPIYAAVINYSRLRQERIGDANIEDIMERLNLVVQYLLAFGADPEGTNAHGFTALRIAQDARLSLLIQMLQGAQPEPEQASRRETLVSQTQTIAPAIITESRIIPEPTRPVVIHAATNPARILVDDELEARAPPSHIHLLFREHDPRAGRDTDETSPTHAFSSDDEAPIGQPGRLPTLRERLTATLRAIPLTGALISLADSISPGPRGQH